MFSILSENFPPFHQNQNCRLQTLSVWKSLKYVSWERLNSLPNTEPNISSKKSLVNTAVKEEIADNQHSYNCQFSTMFSFLPMAIMQPFELLIKFCPLHINDFNILEIPV